MKYLLAVTLFSGIVAVQVPTLRGQSAVEGPPSALKSTSLMAGDIPGIPPAPRGKSTILGGEIRSIDPVRDQLMLKSFGERPVKIFYDERTQVFIDGKKISLRNLAPADHASIQTLLDGTNIFALSIHILSKSPEGDFQGRVVSYRPDTTELTVSSAASREPVKFLLPAGTVVTRVGQPGFVAVNPGAADLVKGALVSVTFASDKQGRGVAQKVSVMATPGAAFVFIGDVASLDMHAGILTLVDPQDQKSYQISFEPGRVPASQNLRPGDHIIVTTDFDGTHYVASAITIDK